MCSAIHGSTNCQLESQIHHPMNTRILSFFTFVLMLVGLLAPTHQAQAKDGELKIRLAASAGVTGFKGAAKYSERRAEREFQVEIEAALRHAGTALVVAVDNVVVGEIKLDALGRGRLNLNTIRREVVPVIKSGSVVKIITPAGALILTGKF